MLFKSFESIQWACPGQTGRYYRRGSEWSEPLHFTKKLHEGAQCHFILGHLRPQPPCCRASADVWVWMLITAFWLEVLALPTRESSPWEQQGLCTVNTHPKQKATILLWLKGNRGFALKLRVKLLMLKMPQGPLGIHLVKRPTQPWNYRNSSREYVRLPPTVHLTACVLGSLVRIHYQTQREGLSKQKT